MGLMSGDTDIENSLMDMVKGEAGEGGMYGDSNIGNLHYHM